MPKLSRVPCRLLPTALSDFSHPAYATLPVRPHPTHRCAAHLPRPLLQRRPWPGTLCGGACWRSWCASSCCPPWRRRHGRPAPPPPAASRWRRAPTRCGCTRRALRCRQVVSWWRGGPAAGCSPQSLATLQAVRIPLLLPLLLPLKPPPPALLPPLPPSLPPPAGAPRRRCQRGRGH